ncbi:MAG: BamA/TamA family outer membrane protein [Bacteroidetes bacterium]|nr:BamA/TamA family outer membrane protein [Bacteroidota bacterium]
MRFFQNKFLFTFLLLALPFLSLHSQEILKVGKIEFIHKDTSSIEDNALADVIGINKVDVFTRSVLGEDIFKMEKFYFDNGYFETKVDTLVKYDLEEKEAFIQFIIKEGRHYRIDSLKYNGLEKISAEARASMDSIKSIRSKRYYNKVLIIQQTNRIVDLLQNMGYMNATVRQEQGTIVTKHDTSCTVDIYFENADTIFYFGKTKININDNKYGVDEKLMYKMIEYEEGDRYSKEVRLMTERNISKYAIVQSARAVVESIEGTKANFTININLTNRTEITPFITGQSIDNKFFFGGGAQYVNKYFWSGGKVLNLTASALVNTLDINRFEFSAGVTQPYAFNKRSTLTDKITLGLYNLEQFRNYYAGNSTILNYFISDHTFYNNASLELNEEIVRFKYYDKDSTLDLFNSVLSLTVTHDNTNDAFNPTKGLYHSVIVGSAGLIPKLVLNAFNWNLNYSQYLKAYTANRFYFQLGSKKRSPVLAAAFKVGSIFEYGSGDKLVPVQTIYKFFSGGGSSLRGWNAQENGMVDKPEDGGNFLLEGSFEMRKDLFPRSKGFLKNLGAVVFVDYGNIWNKASDFNFKEIALDIGAGIRYNLFIGPIRFDVGYKLYDPSKRELSKFAFHFGIGQAF